MGNKIVSIIVPAYNAELYVQQTIESIRSQTYKEIEIICVNDGSTDNTLEILRASAAMDSRIIVFDKQNEGVTKTRRFGFEHSSGEYIGFVDADDFIDPGMIEKLLNNLLTYNADISHCGYDVKGLDGSLREYYNTKQLLVQNKAEGVESLIKGEFEPGLWNKLYKRFLLQAIFENERVDESIKINEDLLMNYYLFEEADSSVYEDICMYHYIKRDDSASTSDIGHNYIWDQISVKKIIRLESKGKVYEQSARKAFLLTILHVYNSLAGTSLYNRDKVKIRELLIENKKDFELLNKKYKAIANAICLCPRGYEGVYRALKHSR